MFIILHSQTKVKKNHQILFNKIQHTLLLHKCKNQAWKQVVANEKSCSELGSGLGNWAVHAPLLKLMRSYSLATTKVVYLNHAFLAKGYTVHGMPREERYSSEFMVGVCHLILWTLILFQTFNDCFHTPPLKSIHIFWPGVLKSICLFRLIL